MASYLLMVGYFIRMIRAVMWYHVSITLIGGALWIGSIHAEWPGQLALIWVALFVDICGAIGIIVVGTAANKMGRGAKDWYDRKFEFIPAINIEHRTERTNAFVSLVFGFSVVALLYQSAHDGIGDSSSRHPIFVYIELPLTATYRCVLRQSHHGSHPDLLLQLDILRDRFVEPADACHSATQVQLLDMVVCPPAIHPRFCAWWRWLGEAGHCL